jgi:hypothetical protein
MFASPNAAAVMNSVPPENRGAASGMLATLQNAGMQMSMAIFFTIIITSLAGGLGATVPGQLAGAGVPAADQAILAHAIASNPTGALFGAFLGQNPMALLLANVGAIPGWVPLSPAAQSSLLAPHFFAGAIRPAFGSALSEAFLVAAGLTALAAVISASRPQKYIHGSERKEPAAAAPSAVSPGPVSEPKDPTPRPTAEPAPTPGKAA